MKAWLKGGLIGGGIGIIGGIYFIFCSGVMCKLGIPISLGNIISHLFTGAEVANDYSWWSGTFYTSNTFKRYTGLISNIILYFIIGSLISSLMSKFRKK